MKKHQISNHFILIGSGPLKLMEFNSQLHKLVGKCDSFIATCVAITIYSCKSDIYPFSWVAVRLQ